VVPRAASTTVRPRQREGGPFPRLPLKRDRARELLGEALSAGTGVLSTQVLQEYFVNATRKLKLDPARAQARIELYLGFEVMVVRVEHLLGAIDLHRLRSLAFWDALVARCAADAGCDLLLTEDLQDGSTLEGVRVQNPFLGG
jgi:predicted nucleic acid-binding protein